MYSGGNAKGRNAFKAKVPWLFHSPFIKEV
jgi:hypothetical protein